jgi:hypothetical protein
MSYSSGFTAVTGATYTAAQYNTYTRDNFSALWVYTTAGDLAYATSATTLGRLAGPGANGYYLESTTSAMQWVSNVRSLGFLINTTTALTSGDDAVRFRIPSHINGWNILGVAASRKSGTGVPTIQIRNVTDAVDVLSTRITIDSGETDSSTAASTATVNTSNDDVAVGDQFAIDIDDAGTNTLFLFVEIRFSKP